MNKLKGKQTEENVTYSEKTLSALKYVAQGLSETPELRAVAKRIARSCVEVFGANVAWIGRAEKDGTVREIAQYPEDHPYPRRIIVRWDESPEGQGPTGKAIRTGEPQFAKDLSTKDHFTPWGVLAERHGLSCSATFPLVSQKRPFGALNLYSDDPDFFTPELIESLQTFTTIVTSALEVSNLYNESTRREKEAESFGDILEHLNAEPDIQQIFPHIAEHIRSLTGCNRVTIALIDDRTNTFTIFALDGSSQVFEQGSKIKLEETSAADDILAGRIHITPDLESESSSLAEKMLLEAGCRSRINIPLISNDKLIGSLNLSWTTPSGYVESQIPLLERIADTIALALERSRLFGEERSRIRELETLLRVSSALRDVQTPKELFSILLDEIRYAFHTDGGAVILLDEVGQNLVVISADGILHTNEGESVEAGIGIRGNVLRTLNPYVTPDYATDTNKVEGLLQDELIGPALFVPMKGGKVSLGVLVVVRKRHQRTSAFTESDVRVLSIIGEIAASTLRRVRSYESAKKRLKRVQALRNIDMAITASLDPRVTLRVLLDEVTSQLNVDAASVLLLNPHTQEMTYSAGRGFRFRDIERTVVRMGKGHTGKAALERRAVIVEDIEKSGEKFERGKLLRKEGFAAYSVSPMISKGKVLGVLEIFHRSPMTAKDGEWLDFLEALAGQAAIAIDNARLFYDLELSNTRLRQAYDETIEGWSRALDIRDHETENHTQRVTEITLRLARAAGVSDEKLAHIRRGALLHDIGKIGIPDYILLKPGKLTEDEWKIMRQHPSIAFELLYPIEYLRPALDIPYCHHEKWDGTGYPRGLRGKDIPLAARLFAVADVWDALTSDRPYRGAWPREKALNYIKSQTGKHFDPEAVDLFLKLIEEGDI